MENKSTEKKEKSKFRIYVEFIPFWCLYKLIHFIPYKLAMRGSAIMAAPMPVLDRKHWQRTVRHIMHAGMAANETEAKAIARSSNREFAKLLIEIIKFDQLYELKKMRFTGSPESIASMQHPDGTPGDQCIIITAHYGNWEVAGTGFSNLANRPMSSLMRAFGNPLIGKLILGHRAGPQHELIDKRAGLRPLLRAAKEGRNLTMLIDQHAAGQEGVVCEFFGHPARVHATPALLHLKTGLPIQPEITRRRSDNFEFDFELGDQIRYTPTDDKKHDIEVITQMCISSLEKMIRKQPEQWLWAPRHWLDIERRGSENYVNWVSEHRKAAAAQDNGEVR
ncbi:MAG: lysophospholipid acyltransferase family protein [Victivallaceae bacterium]|nr:lysophospholipid acyltransferase family protein [Victivallaceae bacterium]